VTTFWIVLAIVIYIFSAVVNLVVALEHTTEKNTEMNEGHFVAVFFPLINTITALAILIIIIRDKYEL
jgi:hypothetical protein